MKLSRAWIELRKTKTAEEADRILEEEYCDRFGLEFPYSTFKTVECAMWRATNHDGSVWEFKSKPEIIIDSHGLYKWAGYGAEFVWLEVDYDGEKSPSSLVRIIKTAKFIDQSS